MGSLTIKAVGARWWAEYPSLNYKNDNPWVSGKQDFYPSNVNGFCGFGFRWPSGVSLNDKRITGIKFHLGSITRETLYMEYKAFRTNADPWQCANRRTQYRTDVNSPYASGSPEPAITKITSACPFVEYAGNRFDNITYNNRGSYGQIARHQTSNISDNTTLNASQINFFVNAWKNGHCVGTPDYQGSYTSYPNESRLVEGSYYWYFERKQYSVYTISNGSPYLEVTYENIKTTFTPSYPVDVNVKSGNETTFSWSVSTEGLPSSGVPVTQSSYTLTITDSSGTSTTYTDNTSNQYRTFPANTFSVGTYTYTISVKLSTGETKTSSKITFYVIGGTDAPTITDVTNTSIPTVTWTSTYQDAVELKVSQDGVNLWESGLLAGPDRRTYEIPRMFEDGEYTVELRLLNTYGYYTDYVSYIFTLNPTKPTAPTKVHAYVNDKYGVEIIGTPAATGKCYVVRREAYSKEWEILGEYSEGFIDYMQKGNIYYEYTLRTYDGGFRDGEWQIVKVRVPEVVIHDGRNVENFAELSLTDETWFDVTKVDSISKTFIKCLGRPYPIKEVGEWITSTRTFSAYVSSDTYKKLVDFSLNAPKVYFKATDEFIVCDVEVKDRGRYIRDGRLIDVGLTQIESDLEVTI